MVLQLPFLKDKFKSALMNGLNIDGIEESASGDPVYGGTSTGEDWPDFTVYVANKDEMRDPRALSVPALIVQINQNDGQFQFFGAESEGITVTIYVLIPYTYSITVEDVTYNRADACDILNDRLKKFLRKLVIHEITIAGEGQISPIDTADTTNDVSMFWMAGATRYFDYLPDGIQ